MEIKLWLLHDTAGPQEFFWLKPTPVWIWNYQVGGSVVVIIAHTMKAGDGNMRRRAAMIAYHAKPLPVALASNMGTGSSPSCTTSHSVPCLLSGKAVERGPSPWDSVPRWETWKRLLASDPLCSGCFSHLQSKPVDGRSLFYFSFYVNLPLTQKYTLKKGESDTKKRDMETRLWGLSE